MLLMHEQVFFLGRAELEALGGQAHEGIIEEVGLALVFLFLSLLTWLRDDRHWSE